MTNTDGLHFLSISIDCADPDELGDFYLNLLGGEVAWRPAISVGVRISGLLLIAQRMESYVRPVWPGASIVHLDLTAGDQLDGPEARALSLGATLADFQPDDRWRVLLDPAGHPFLHNNARAIAIAARVWRYWLLKAASNDASGRFHSRERM